MNRFITGTALTLLLAAAAMPATGATDAACTACHREPALTPDRGTHGPATGATCSTCHQAGTNHPAGGAGSVTTFGARSPTPVPEQNASCLACHQGDLPAWHGGTHAGAEVGCADCHRAHVPADPMGEPRAEAAVCGACHARARTDSRKPYRHPVAEGLMSCSACHAPHDSAVAGSLRRATVNETCYECHPDKRGPFLFEHPPAAEDCGLCHAPHGSIHPAMLTRRGPLLCQQCHTQAGHPSIVSTPAGLPGGTPSPLLLGGNCLNCHAQVHGSNHPSGVTEMR